MKLESSAKLACKQLSGFIFPSDEHPMHLDLETGQDDALAL